MLKNLPIHSSFSVFLNIVQTFQETGSMDNKKRIKKATDDGNSTNILAAVALNPLVQDSLNVKMVLVDEVFCEYSIPTNFIPSISHFIENYMAMIFKIVYNSVNGHKDYKKIICLSLKSYLPTKLHLQTMDMINLRNMHCVSRMPTLNERNKQAETLVYKRLRRNS